MKKILRFFYVVIFVELLPSLRFPRFAFRLTAITAELATLCQYEAERFP